VNLEDAERIKLNADELIKNNRKPGTSEATKKRQLLLNQKPEDDEDEDLASEGKKKDIIDVTSLEVDGVKTISKKLFDEIIEARLSEIFDIVIQQIEQSGNEARLPAGVVITGGSSLIPGITSVAKKVFGVPARVGYPKGLDGLTDEISTPAYAVSQGLILSSASDETYSAGRKQISLKASKNTNFLGKVSSFFKNLIP
jgi:cell division protein FtsA